MTLLFHKNTHTQKKKKNSYISTRITLYSLLSVCNILCTSVCSIVYGITVKYMKYILVALSSTISDILTKLSSQKRTGE